MSLSRPWHVRLERSWTWIHHKCAHDHELRLFSRDFELIYLYKKIIHKTDSLFPYSSIQAAPHAGPHSAALAGARGVCGVREACSGSFAVSGCRTRHATALQPMCDVPCGRHFPTWWESGVLFEEFELPFGVLKFSHSSDKKRCKKFLCIYRVSEN